jgi:hypothetical protein
MRAGVASVAGQRCETLLAESLRSILTSGLPERLHPGFWDNDGRCCGTTGVAEVFLDHAQRDDPDGQYRAFADTLAGALVDRAIEDPDNPSMVYWRFIEHRADRPLLDPGVGWMQGAAGISAYLFRHARVEALDTGAPRQSRPDN